MRPAPPTVEQLALAYVTGQRTVDVWNRIDPTAMPDFALAHLRKKGVNPVGDPSLVAYALARAQEEIEAIFDYWDAVPLCEARVGRPSARPEQDLILTAAYFKFKSQGMKPTAARRAAAQFLGATASRVEKGVKRGIQRVWRHRHVVPLADGYKLHARFIASAQVLLEECAEERRALMKPRRNRA